MAIQYKLIDNGKVISKQDFIKLLFHPDDNEVIVSWEALDLIKRIMQPVILTVVGDE